MRSSLAGIGIGIGAALTAVLTARADTPAAEPPSGDPSTAQVASSLGADAAVWVEPGARPTGLTRIPAGWTSVDVPGAPVGSVLVAPGLAVTPAVACPGGFSCLYQNASRTGFVVAVQSGIGIGNLTGVACPQCTNGIHGNNGTFNDQMTSWENETGRQYCWWFNAGPAGEVHTMPSGVIVNVLARENDQASAFGPC